MRNALSPLSPATASVRRVYALLRNPFSEADVSELLVGADAARAPAGSAAGGALAAPPGAPAARRPPTTVAAPLSRPCRAACLCMTGGRRDGPKDCA
jgi:hypothetical protein